MKQVIQLLDEVLGLQGRGKSFTRSSALLGAVPELDSMAVASVIAALEERFGFSIDDDEIDGTMFADVGSLVDFVQGKLNH